MCSNKLVKIDSVIQINVSAEDQQVFTAAVPKSAVPVQSLNLEYIHAWFYTTLADFSFGFPPCLPSFLSPSLYLFLSSAILEITPCWGHFLGVWRTGKVDGNGSDGGLVAVHKFTLHRFLLIHGNLWSLPCQSPLSLLNHNGVFVRGDQAQNRLSSNQSCLAK